MPGSALPDTMGKQKKRKQSKSPHHSNSRSPSHSGPDRHQLSTNSVSPNEIPSTSQLLSLGLSPSTLQQDLPSLSSSIGLPATASAIAGGPLEALPVMANIATNSCAPNFEGFSSSSPQGDDSDTDSVITAGQRCDDEGPGPRRSCVILIEPVSLVDGGDPQPSQVDLKRFLSNDLVLSKALANSLLGRTGIASISKNIARNLLVVTMKASPDVSRLLEVEKLGSWRVKCRLPANHATSVGVIGPFGGEVSNEELTEALTSEGYQGAIAERILKGRELSRTSMFKVTFPCNTLPSYVTIGYQRFRVNIFIAKPWQCFRCQRFAHSALTCKSPPRCVVCGGGHGVKECSNVGAPKCCNCGGAHTANYGGCPRMKQANAVEKTRSMFKLSYSDAVKHVQTKQAESHKSPLSFSSNVNSSPDAGFPHLPASPLRTSNWSMANNFKSSHSAPAQITKHSVSTQTTGPAQQPLEANISLTQLIHLLSQVLSLCNNSDSATAKETISKLAADTFKLFPSPEADPCEGDPPCSAVAAATNSENISSQPTAPHGVSAPVSAMEATVNDFDMCADNDQINPSPVLGGPSSKKKFRTDTIRPSPVIGGKSRQMMVGKQQKILTKASETSRKPNQGK